MPAERAAELARFYDLLARLETRIGGRRTLSESHGRLIWPGRGVYFFFEPGEERSGSGTGPRVVRVGTHAVSAGSRTTLWNRLSLHRGTAAGHGNHRGSIFRLLVGAALARRDPALAIATWGRGSSAPADIRAAEASLERQVSAYIGAMPFLWLDIDDASGPESLRARIERGAIALLSDYDRTPVDPPFDGWLGRFSDRDRVRRSGLWNNDHVERAPAPEFLDLLERLVDDG